MSIKALEFSEIKKSPSLLLGFGLGSGLSKFAPGTMGTLAAIPLFFILNILGSTVYTFALIIAIVVGVKICADCAEYTKTHDHGGIVWDEFCGFWITMWLVPINVTTIIAGFILFRFFDIIKPWPISWVDKKVSGGVGIMADDIIAGIIANVILHAGIYLLN